MDERVIRFDGLAGLGEATFEESGGGMAGGCVEIEIYRALSLC